MATNSKSKNVPKTKSPSASASPNSSAKLANLKDKKGVSGQKAKVAAIPPATKKSKTTAGTLSEKPPVAKIAEKKSVTPSTAKKADPKMKASKLAGNAIAESKVKAPKPVASKSLSSPKSTSAKVVPAASATKSTQPKKSVAVSETKAKSAMAPGGLNVKSSKSDKAVGAKKVVTESVEAKNAGSKKIGAVSPKAISNKTGDLKTSSTEKTTAVKGLTGKASPTKTAVSEKPDPAPINNGPPTDPKILAKIRGMQSDQEKRKDFAQPPTAKPVLVHSSKLFEQAKDPEKDRLILMVRDPYWLHACWDITRKSVERAKAALAGHWHAARPVLRLLRTEDNSTTSNSESVFKDIMIHGGVRNWYIDIEDAETTFRILLGYLFANGRFHELARSNPVTTPVPGSPDATDDHWADIATDAERVYALSGGYDEESTQAELQQMMQEKLKRPVGTPAMSQFGSGAEGSLKRSKNFHFTLDAEMVVFGSTPANAYLTLNGEPIKIRSDGTYSARVPLPNNRQVMAATSKSRDGLDEQTIVIAVERNTKIMEPLSLTEPDMD